MTNRSFALGPRESRIMTVRPSDKWQENATVLLTPTITLNEARVQEAVALIGKDGLVLIHVSNNYEHAVAVQRGTEMGHIELILMVENDMAAKQLARATINTIETWPAEARDEAVRTLSDAELTPEEKDVLEELLNRREGLFAMSKMDLGKTDVVKHSIDTQGQKPTRQRAYRIPYALADIARKEVTDLLEQDLITPSNSPWAAPVLLIEKKNGEHRFCIDYRKLNELQRRTRIQYLT